MPLQMKCEIVSARMLSGTCADIRVSASKMARMARPGHFVHIDCGDALLLRRPISIAGAEGDVLRICVDIRGKGTKWLSERRAGEFLDIIGPIGRAFTPVSGHALFIGGGVGAPPMLFGARSHGGESHTILGFRTKELAILTEDFEAASLSLEVCTDDGTLGKKALTTDLAREYISSRKVDMIYACGPVPMLRGVAKLAEETGIPCEVSMEQRMACGIGACLGCACKAKDEAGKESYRRVCIDGPVFSSKEVVL